MKTYKTPEQQLNILSNNHKLLTNGQEKIAISMLKNYGYHEIVNGYQDVFKQDHNLSENFDKNTTFVDLANMFYLDMQLRAVLRTAIEQFEMTFKETVSECIAQKYGENDTVHLNRKIFRSGKFHKSKQGKPYSDLDWLQGRIRHALKSQDGLIEHHRLKGNIPPWILFKQLSFGEIKTYFALLNDSHLKDSIIRRMLQPEFIKSSNMGNSKTFLIELINLVHLFRNRALHANRIFNYAPMDKYGNSSINVVKQIFPDVFDSVDYSDGIGRTGIYALILGFSTLNNSDPFTTLEDYIDNSFLAKFNEPKYLIFISMSLKYPLNFLDFDKYLVQDVKPPIQAKKHY
ncbi:MAG: Abi family protein [Lactobacillaceae bacterium]|jgi:abortive infection bacteriophage resistance protein|nr:Abi family protein [Lactobacillaceae bacterium]